MKFGKNLGPGEFRRMGSMLIRNDSVCNLRGDEDFGVIR
jgi:hypothetical protein